MFNPNPFDTTELTNAAVAELNKDDPDWALIDKIETKIFNRRYIRNTLAAIGAAAGVFFIGSKLMHDNEDPELES